MMDDEGLRTCRPGRARGANRTRGAHSAWGTIGSVLAIQAVQPHAPRRTGRTLQGHHSVDHVSQANIVRPDLLSNEGDLPIP